MNTSEKLVRISKLVNCARCGDNHGELTFLELTYPNGENTHWCPCPTNDEPIMMRIIPEDET